jgi:E3 ubiquitin-protein ligase MARCH6
VAVFLAIELAVFPLLCGAFLDICTMPLFPGVTFSTRLAYRIRAPLSATFLTWLVRNPLLYYEISLTLCCLHRLVLPVGYVVASL